MRMIALAILALGLAAYAGFGMALALFLGSLLTAIGAVGALICAAAIAFAAAEGARP